MHFSELSYQFFPYTNFAAESSSNNVFFFTHCITLFKPHNHCRLAANWGKKLVFAYFPSAFSQLTDRQSESDSKELDEKCKLRRTQICLKQSDSSRGPRANFQFSLALHKASDFFLRDSFTATATQKVKLSAS